MPEKTFSFTVNCDYEIADYSRVPNINLSEAKIKQSSENPDFTNRTMIIKNNYRNNTASVKIDGVGEIPEELAGIINSIFGSKVAVPMRFDMFVHRTLTDYNIGNIARKLKYGERKEITLTYAGLTESGVLNSGFPCGGIEDITDNEGKKYLISEDQLVPVPGEDISL